MDRTAVFLTAARGEDGHQLARIMKANPADLERFFDPDFTARVVPLRQVHAAYIPLLEGMARGYGESKVLFATVPDEREAGRKAPVWTAIIRTQRTQLLGVDDVKRIVREALTTRV